MRPSGPRISAELTIGGHDSRNEQCGLVLGAGRAFQIPLALPFVQTIDDGNSFQRAHELATNWFVSLLLLNLFIRTCPAVLFLAPQDRTAIRRYGNRILLPWLWQVDAYARSNRGAEGSVSALLDESADSDDVDCAEIRLFFGAESIRRNTPANDGQSAVRHARPSSI